MAIPANVNVVVVQGYWFDESTGGGVDAKLDFHPVRLGGSAATPNLTDLTARAWLKTRDFSVTPDPATGYYAVALVANDDPDLDAFGGWQVTPDNEDTFTIAVPSNSPTTTVTSDMAAATGLTVGASVQAMWLTDAAVLTTDPPTPPAAYLTATQTASVLAAGISSHNTDGTAHPDIRTLIAGVTGAVSSVAGRTGDVTLTKADVGLNNVNNTADLNKVVSSATQAALDAKADTSSLATVATSGSYSDLSGQPAIPASYGDLTGTVPSSALPALAINDTFVVADEAAMLALTAQRGDIAIRQDRIDGQQPAVFILSADDASTLANWINLPVPADAVVSVAGKTGAVVLAKADVGLAQVDNTADSAKPVSTAQQAAIDAVAAAVPEQARDAVGAALVAGTGISVVVDDAADTITIAASGGGGSSYTDEQVQDVVAALLAAGTQSGITFTYDDAGNALSASVSAQSWSQITGKPTFAAVATSGSASDITTGTLPDSVIPAGIARDSEVTTAIQAVVGAAPTALDTLQEIAAQLQSDETAAGALTTAVAGKAPALTQSATKTANYTAADNEIVPLDTSGGTFTLTGPTSGKPFGFRWKAGTAAPTIAAPAGYTITGLASVTPALAPSTSSGELIAYQAFGTDYQPISGFKPQSALDTLNDARYTPAAHPSATTGVHGIGSGTFESTTGSQAKVDTHAASTTAHARLVMSDVLAQRTVAGAVSDASFTTPPPDGAEAVDTVNLRKYIRAGGSWYYTPLTSAAVFTPASIANLYGWWDASQITGVADNTALATWPDLSGNSRSLTQATGANQPTYRTAQQNGKAVVRCAGSHWMATANFSPALTQPFTIFAVVRAAATGVDQDILGGGSALNRLYLRARSSNTYSLWQQLNANSVATVLSNGSNDGTAHVFTFVSKGGVTGGGNTTRLRVNGVEVTSDNMGTGVPANLLVGSAGVSGVATLTGDLMEIGLYNRELTTTELQQLEAYLS